MDRARADWPIVGAAWLIMLLATTLLATGPIYSSAVSLAGLHRVLADAAPASVNVGIALRAPTEEVERVDATVRGQVAEAIGGAGTTVAFSARSGTFALPGQPAGEVRDLTELGVMEGIEGHATLLAGGWPVSDLGAGQVGVAISEQVAELLGAGLGDELRLVSRLDEQQVVTARIEGVYRIDDPSEPFWWDDDRLLAGLEESDAYRTIGPLLTTRAALLRQAGSSLSLTWHAFPDLGALRIEDVDRLRSGVAELPTRLEIAVPEASASIETELGNILAGSERSLLVSRTGVLLLIVQLAVLAAYAIVLTAGLLVEHRRVDTSLLRSRGAGPLQVAGLSLIEGLVLAVPAALAAPWLAAAALGILNVAGPLAEIGLAIEPRVGAEAYVAAGAAAAGCVVLLVLPALLAARSFAAEQGGLSRHETRTIGQRMGIDIALLAITAIGFWQLRLYGAPLTRNVRGTLGLDPLLVAAPAIGLLAGGVLALRLVPLLAVAGEALVTRGRHLVGALGARQLARRPLRYTRAALLLMLAMSMGIFAVSYASTWSRSQEHQASHQVGSDVRVTPRFGPRALPAWATASALRAAPGVARVIAVERQRVNVSRAAGSGELLGIDPAAMDMVDLRGDLASAPLPSVMQPLVDARPQLRLVGLPGEPLRVRLEADVQVDELVMQQFDPEAGVTDVPVDPASLAGRPVLAAAITLRDADGLLHRFTAPAVPLAEGMEAIVVPLRPDQGAGADGRLSYPLAVAGAELSFLLPGEQRAVAGQAGIVRLAVSEEAEGETWTNVDLQAAGGWRTSFQGVTGDAEVPSDALDGLVMEVGSARPLSGDGQGGPASTLRYTASAIARVAGSELAVIVNQAFLDGTGLRPGEAISLRLDGEQRQLRLAGSVRSFPTTDPGRPLVLADRAVLDLQRFASGAATGAPDEWWLSVADGSASPAAAAVRAAPISAAAVVTREERLQALSADPVALGIIGALSMGFVVAGLFAVIGLAVSAAVSARQRRTEFALLRALGLSGGQLARWLWLENASLVLVSLLAGTALGLAIGWVVLPFITVTQAGTTPFPPVLLEVPWASILLLELVSVVALVVTVVLLAAVLRRIGIGSVLRMGED
jgi:ABC-type lipoprotein release transport system permease subunit